MTAPVSRRIAEIKEALAKVLPNGSYELVAEKDGLFLRPIVHGWDRGSPILPLIDINRVARDLERYLS